MDICPGDGALALHAAFKKGICYPELHRTLLLRVSHTRYCPGTSNATFGRPCRTSQTRCLNPSWPSLVGGAAGNQVQVKPTSKSKTAHAQLKVTHADMTKQRPHHDDEPPDPCEGEPADANDGGMISGDV